MSETAEARTEQPKLPYKLLIRLGLLLIYLVGTAVGGYVTFTRVRDQRIGSKECQRRLVVPVTGLGLGK